MEITDDFFTKAWIIESTALNAVTKSTSIFMYVSEYTEKDRDTFSAKLPDGSIVRHIKVMCITLLCYTCTGIRVYRIFGADDDVTKAAIQVDLHNKAYDSFYSSMSLVDNNQPKEPYALPPDEDWQWLGDGWYRR